MNSYDDYYYGEMEEEKAGGIEFNWPNQFCADPLWINQNVGNGSLSLMLPTFTRCFQHALLAQMGPLLMLMGLPILWVQLVTAKRERREARMMAQFGNSNGGNKHNQPFGADVALPFDTLARMRYVITIVLFMLKLAMLLLVCYEWLWPYGSPYQLQPPLVDFLYPVTHMATLTALLYYTERCRRLGLVGPGVIFWVWLAFVLSGMPEFLISLAQTRAGKQHGMVDLLLNSWIPLAWWPLCCVQLFLHCFAGKVPLQPGEEPNSSPESRAAFPNRQFYAWFDSLVRLGHSRPLSESDVFRMRPALGAQRLFQRWQREWDRQMDKYTRQIAQLRMEHWRGGGGNKITVMKQHVNGGSKGRTKRHRSSTIMHNAKNKRKVRDSSGGGTEVVPIYDADDGTATTSERTALLSSGVGIGVAAQQQQQSSTTTPSLSSMTLPHTVYGGTSIVGHPLRKHRHSSSMSSISKHNRNKDKLAPKQPSASDGSGQQRPLPSLLACLWRLFKWDVSGAMVAKLGSDLLQFASPLLLGQLIAFTEDLSLPTWWGFAVAAALFLASELRSLFINHYFMVMNIIGCCVQSVLASAVYSKTLRLSSIARRGRTSGEIVNLMAIDVDRFQQCIPLLQQLWSSPLQVTIALLLLYQYIGWAVAGGVAVMLALIPCNLCVVRLTKRWQMEQMSCKDRRLRMINETLSGIRAVKLYAWEVPMMCAIEEVRHREVQLIRRAFLLRICSEVMNIASPIFVAIISFILYILPDPQNHRLTPEIAFVSLTLFSQLRIPLIVLAELIGQLIQTAVSNRRLKEFMVADEVDPEAVQRDQSAQYERAIDVEFASFDWQQPELDNLGAGAADSHRTGLDSHHHPSASSSAVMLKKHSTLPPGHQHALREGHLAICMPYTLNNMELHIRRGLLVAVVGRVGAGKSSLLSALLGEMHKVYGYVGLRGQVAYVPQQPWILNRTVRENIIFPVDDDQQQHQSERGTNTMAAAPPAAADDHFYQQVVAACALSADFAMLPDGDRTEIGERGINLSGGQKARINLARALYRQADIYLLDDPLSAVDAMVGRHLFQRAIGPQSMAKDSTRVLVTHSLTYLQECDWIVVLEDGQVKRQGTYEELLQEPETAQLIVKLDEEEDQADETEEEEEKDEAKEIDANGEGEEEGEQLVPAGKIVFSPSLDGQRPKQIVRRTKSSASSGSKTARRVTADDREEARLIRRRKKSGGADDADGIQAQIEKQKLGATEVGKLVKEEGAETGHVRASIYRDYFAAMRWRFFIGFMLFSLLQFAMNLLQSFWLSSWSDDNSPTAPPGPKMPLWIRLSVYTLQGALIVVFLASTSVAQVLGSVSASIRLHGPLLNQVLHAPISFFDITPLGRILNRFGKEFDTVDSRLASAVRMLMFSMVNVLIIVLLISISLPLFIVLIVPVSILYLIILRYFIPTSRQLQRLASVARSPLYNLFAETINGCSSIRAFGVGQSFFANFCAKLDAHIGCRYFSLISSRWLSMRLELIGNLVILCCAILAVFARDWGTVTAGLIGLSVSKSLDITFILNFLVRNINEVELSIVSVERIMEYKNCPQEPNWHSPVGQEPPANWPGQGAVRFDNFSCRYRTELGLTLRSVNAQIQPQEKIGVVGRTGAGKTSLALSLFRIVEAAEGRILIDSIDIGRVGLQELRSRITIIPQDPVLFSGTLRFNLDPFGVYDDAQLWAALENVHLKAFVESQPNRLFHDIAEGGENISVGQRQLLCLARAILRRSALIVLDEATASIDAQTDTLIQRTIRTEFRHSTILTIAHRISTVMDYDRIMVLADGRLVEFDRPAALMANKNTYFYGLVQSASNKGDNVG